MRPVTLPICAQTLRILSADAVKACRAYIGSNFEPRYLPDTPKVFSSKDGAQEAHEAIRPSDVNILQTALSGMERDAERLYELIWRQFVAGQMSDAEYTSTLGDLQRG